MSSSAEFFRWQASCRDRGDFGATHGDTFALGLRDYNQLYPCPNGLPLDSRPHIEIPSWVARIEKARRCIATHQAMFRVRELAENISAEQIINDIREISTWARSLYETK